MEGLPSELRPHCFLPGRDCEASQWDLCSDYPLPDPGGEWACWGRGKLEDWGRGAGSVWWALLPLGGLGGTGLEQGLQGWRGVVAEGEEWGLQPCHQAAWVRILAACPWLLALSVPLWRCLDKLYVPG